MRLLSVTAHSRTEMKEEERRLGRCLHPASLSTAYAYDDGQALRELKASSRAGCLTHDVYLMVEALARWHGWEWEHGAANTCRSGTEATPHHRRRSTPDPTNDSFDNGIPKAKDAAKSSVGTPEFAPAPDEFTVAWVGCARHLTLCYSGTWLLAFAGWQKQRLANPKAAYEHRSLAPHAWIPISPTFLTCLRGEDRL
ncbi:hypothetical protein Landi51_00340 [Colletotrichum acutatum]